MLDLRSVVHRGVGVVADCCLRAQADTFAPLLLQQEQQVGGCGLVIPPLRELRWMTLHIKCGSQILCMNGAARWIKKKHPSLCCRRTNGLTSWTSAVVLCLDLFMLTAISVIQSSSMWPSCEWAKDRTRDAAAKSNSSGASCSAQKKKIEKKGQKPLDWDHNFYHKQLISLFCVKTQKMCVNQSSEYVCVPAACCATQQGCCSLSAPRGDWAAASQ